MVTIDTGRLRLRVLRESDFEAYAEMCGDAEGMQYIGDGQPLDRPMAWRNMATMAGHWVLRGYGMWAVEERTSGEFVGRIGLWMPEGWPGIELGWGLRRQFWGRGYATEGAQAALRFAFTEMNLPHIISQIHPDNAASVRVALRLGETLHGKGELFGRPVLVYRITRDEWQSRMGPSL